ncbi:MAG: hypothetical protein RLO52_29290 [Sandaracinaceae bacterium]
MLRHLSSCLVPVLLLLGCQAELCDASSLQAALDAAGEGGRVRAGDCRIEGGLRIPPGVTLEGAEETVLAPGADASIVLQAGPTETTLRGLRVEALGGVGVQLGGEGAAAVEDVIITVDRGVGLVAEGVARLRVTRVSVEGAVDAAAAMTLPDTATPERGGSYGLWLVDVGTEAAPAELSDVDLRDVGPWGGVVASSQVRWTGGDVEGVTGTGVLVQGGAVSLEGVRVATLRQGIQLAPAYGLASVDGAALETRGLVVTDGEGVGVIHAGGEATHAALSVVGQRRGGVRAQADATLRLGEGSVLTANGLAGVLAVGGSVDVDGLEITGTVLTSALVGETIRADVGDGLQLTGVRGSLASVIVRDNARIGLLIDVGAIGIGALSLTDVTAGAEGSALGAVAQDDAGPLSGWDGAITREGASVANDAAHAGLLDTVSPADATPPSAPALRP